MWIDGAYDGGEICVDDDVVAEIVSDGHVLIWYDWYGEGVNVKGSGSESENERERLNANIDNDPYDLTEYLYDDNCGLTSCGCLGAVMFKEWLILAGSILMRVNSNDIPEE